MDEGGIADTGSRTRMRSGTDLQKAELDKELLRTGVTLEAVMERYRIEKVEDMTPEVYEKALRGLKRTKTKAA